MPDDRRPPRAGAGAPRPIKSGSRPCSGGAVNKVAQVGGNLVETD
jgi:hypothetical protein